MPASTTIPQGDEVVLYVMTTAPTTATSPAEYDVVDLQDGHTFAITRETTEVRTKLATAKSVGAAVETWTISCVRALDTAAGQDILLDAARATTAATLYFLEYPNAVGKTGHTFTAKVESLSGDNGTGAPPKFTATLALQAVATPFVRA